MGAVLEGQSVMCQDLGQGSNMPSIGETECDVPGFRAAS